VCHRQCIALISRCSSLWPVETARSVCRSYGGLFIGATELVILILSLLRLPPFLRPAPRELATRRHPFQGMHPMKIRHEVLHGMRLPVCTVDRRRGEGKGKE